MILVAGGTGTLGTPLVRLLTGAGDPVRVLTRGEQRADHLRDTGVEVVVGDVRVPAHVTAAVHGCTTVISAVHGFTGRAGPAGVDRAGNHNLIRAARDAGADRLILVSVYGAAPIHPMSLHRMKYAAEQLLVNSGLRWTIIRPVPFLETWIDVLGANLATHGKAVVPGPGDNPVNLVSARDVATVIDRAVRDDAMIGRTVDVVGPEALTLRYIAEQLVAVNDRPGRVVHVPLAALRIMSVLAKPVVPAFARQARAAVIMNTTDMTAADHDRRCLSTNTTTLDQLLSSPAAKG